MATDPRWVNIVERNLHEILIDHAFCEQKAASNAISMIVQYPFYVDLVQAMTEICQEEMMHFDMVHQKLLDRGFDARGEVSYRDKKAPRGYRQCRFDIVIFENQVATKIIEVKNYDKTNFDTRQDKKYSAFGIDLIYCTSIESIEDVMLKLT